MDFQNAIQWLSTKATPEEIEEIHEMTKIMMWVINKATPDEIKQLDADIKSELTFIRNNKFYSILKKILPGKGFNQGSPASTPNPATKL